MKRLFPLLLCLFLTWAVVPAPAGEVLDRIIVIVDEDIILESEVLELLQQYQLTNNLDPQRDADQLERQRAEILNSLIQEKILLAKARADSLVADEAKVDREVQQTLDNFIRQAGTEKKLTEIFQLSMNQIRQKLRENTRNNLLISQVTQKFLAGITVNGKEVREFYETYRDSLPEVPEMVHAGQIFREIKVSPESEERAFRLASALRDSILEGQATFEELVERHSADPGTKNRGGLIGDTRRGTLLHEYEEVAYDMRPGEISQPVRTRFGYHIIRLEGRSGETITTSHILIKLTPSKEDVEAAKAAADTLAAHLRKYDDFKRLAVRLADRSGTGIPNGDLGLLAPSDFTPALQPVLNALEPGDVSDPQRISLDGRDGFVIIKLWERRPPHPMNPENDWDRLENFALQYKKQQRLQEWVEELKKETFIKIIDED